MGLLVLTELYGTDKKIIAIRFNEHYEICYKKLSKKQNKKKMVPKVFLYLNMLYSATKQISFIIKKHQYNLIMLCRNINAQSF